jgi:hypothetical protein
MRTFKPRLGKVVYAARSGGEKAWCFMKKMKNGKKAKKKSGKKKNGKPAKRQMPPSVFSFIDFYVIPRALIFTRVCRLCFITDLFPFLSD